MDRISIERLWDLMMNYAYDLADRDQHTTSDEVERLAFEARRALLEALRAREDAQ